MYFLYVFKYCTWFS